MGREAVLPSEKQAPKELKVTDKRIFTADGQIREEFRDEIKPATAEEAKPPQPAQAQEPPKQEPKQERTQRSAEERRRTMAEKATNPGTPFGNFIQSLVMQTYMFLGMLRDPRAPQPMFDATAARETIDILTLLREKTAGTLTPEEEDSFDAHLGELKLAYVQRTKNIS